MSPQKSPVSKLKDLVALHAVSNAALFNFPYRWEKYGDMVIFNNKLIKEVEWKSLPIEFLVNVCKILQCKRLAVKGAIQNDGFRTPSAAVIFGSDPWAIFRDNGVLYTWNIETNMFCAGNAPERHRIATLDCKGQTVADLFAGIGYFTIPYLVHAKAAFVHACEWNPMAVSALKKNLSLNKVEEYCKVYEGNNKEANIDGIADRVNLGLIPSSEGSWPTACRALKPSGGVLCVHGNVESLKAFAACACCPEDVGGDSQQWRHSNWRLWGCHVVHCISQLMRDIRGVNYACTVANVHCVKSYAPHVHHLVLDVFVQPARGECFCNT